VTTIRPYETRDHGRVHAVCVAAFTPVHLGFEQALGRDIFAVEYNGWRERYARDIEQLAAAPDTELHVLEVEDEIAGFVTTTIHADRNCGEIGLNAIDPEFQGRGYARDLYTFALENLKQRGAAYAYVGTGADAAHAPARAAYEAVGFDRVIPANHYYRKL
jgi:ribosomal protein S18 acetylase RimI-like enzyme